MGLLSDNVVILTTKRNKSEERIKEKLSQVKNQSNTDGDTIVKQSIDESDLNLAAVREIYKGFYCEMDTSDKKTHDIIDEIAVSSIRFIKILRK